MPWGLGPGNTLGRGSYDLQLVRMRPEAIAQSPSNPWSGNGYETNEGYYEAIARNIAGIARNITGILPDVLGFSWNMSNTIGKTIGNIS